MRDWILMIIEHTASKISVWAWDKRVNILEKEREKIQKWLKKK